MTRFSIIVPVYNAQQHLNDCLDSVLGQTFQNFEVICVNDGSTDDSRDILEARAAGDARIRVLDKANGGPSSARNDGIRVAQGDYLCFLDSDDALEPDALEQIGRVFDAGAYDAVVFGWSYEPRAQADRFVREHAEVRDAYYASFSPDLLFSEMSNPYLRLAVRRDALAASGVLFDEALRVGEDAQFLFALYPRIGAVKLVSSKLYRYRLPHEGSIMAEYADDVAQLCMGDLDAAISIFADWKEGGLLEPYGSQLMRWFVKGQLYTILRQPPAVREPLTALVRQMWRANFSVQQLVALRVGEPTARLVRIVLGASEEGRLVVDERELSQALLTWRVAEYGVADLAVTAVQRATSFLIENRRMLLKGPASDDVAQREDDDSGMQTAPEVQDAFEVRGVYDEAEAEELGGAPELSDAADVPGAGAADGADTAGASDASAAADGTPLVSVIVPIYNVERYLDQALSSIEAQTLRALEIICVDDGSTDGSAAVVAEHAQRDARIRLVSKPNGGYGSACNAGIAQARGTWIAIVEPDDWIEPGMYEALTSFAVRFEEPVDVVKGPYWRIWMPDTDRERRVNCSYRGRIKPAAQPFTLVDPGVTHLIIHHPSIWSALYARDFLERCQIRFAEIPGAGWADNPFLAETLVQARAIAYLDEPFYNYREETPQKSEDFARRSWKVSIDRWHDMADVYERLGVTEEAILRAHVRRGFTYVGHILEYHDLDAEPDVRECVASVFERMDDALVFSETHVSPGSKRLYAQVKGVDAPGGGSGAYALEVARGGFYNLANTGPGMTIDTLKGFVSSHAKREGK